MDVISFTAEMIIICNVFLSDKCDSKPHLRNVTEDKVDAYSAACMRRGSMNVFLLECCCCVGLRTIIMESGAHWHCHGHCQVKDKSYNYLTSILYLLQWKVSSEQDSGCLHKNIWSSDCRLSSIGSRQ